MNIKLKTRMLRKLERRDKKTAIITAIPWVILFFFIVFYYSASADHLKGDGRAACLSEELYDELTTASARKDYPHIEYLLKNGCFVVKKGLKVSVLDTTWTGKAKVRAYSMGRSLILWTNRENIAREEN